MQQDVGQVFNVHHKAPSPGQQKSFMWHKVSKIYQGQANQGRLMEELTDGLSLKHWETGKSQHSRSSVSWGGGTSECHHSLWETDSKWQSWKVPDHSKALSLHLYTGWISWNGHTMTWGKAKPGGWEFLLRMSPDSVSKLLMVTKVYEEWMRGCRCMHQWKWQIWWWRFSNAMGRWISACYRTDTINNNLNSQKYRNDILDQVVNPFMVAHPDIVEFQHDNATPPQGKNCQQYL